MTTNIFNVLQSIFNQLYITLTEIQFFGIPLLVILTSMLIASITVGVFSNLSR